MTAALMPALAGVSAVPAAAATGNTLTVTAISRTGARVAATAEVMNLADESMYSFATGKAHALPKGTYAVLADIQTTGAGGAVSDTIGSQIVTVSGAKSVTLDARQGRAVHVSLDSNPAPADQWTIDSRVCADGMPVGDVEVSNNQGSLYVVPNASKDLQFAYLADLQGSTGYMLSGMTTGIPSNPGGAFRKAALALVHVQARSGDEEAAQTDVEFQPEGPTDNCQTDLAGPGDEQDGPFNQTVYVSPGRWEPRSDVFGGPGDLGGEFAAQASFAGGHTYWETFGQATWGPVSTVPTVWERAIDMSPDGLIEDPTPGTMTFGSSVWSTFELTQGSKVLKKQNLNSYGNQTDFNEPIRYAGWYNLSVDAHRYGAGFALPSGTLSNEVTLGLHFYASPSVTQAAPVYLTHFLPGGLNAYNAATPKGSMPITLDLDRGPTGNPDAPLPNDPVKSVLSWYSTDGGKSWHALAVKRSGSAYTVAVPDPASGAVSLRSEVVDTKGDTSTETVYRAYTIG
ncbi:hypothetical protein GXW83_31185 [Streptacidiphilus sp. PB12-B1b]|uniref:hypothetical protein n=1 Tax=Streptacidiphilus sp. PB12-B1b TaxID=2705012 RepID=UPI0015FB2DDC|nr:hypothetical protein [Streptacidiphilus sp. PB12-B1b]QMU79504.1 hypothetical protein GXW83_31185 [Streptacidiphilus sp. PB12-B1b]